MTKFKAGDKVYVPHLGTSIFTLEADHSTDKVFSLIIDSSPINQLIGFHMRPVKALLLLTKTGQLHDVEGMPCIWYATNCNMNMLEAMYGKNFDTPPPEPKQHKVKIDDVNYLVPETMTIKQILNS